MWLISLILVASITHISICMDCSKTECIRIADPLIREPQLIFPDNMDDIVVGCRTWDRFVNCLKDYTDHCFTDQQRKAFNNAVESPIENIHQLCMDRNYQAQYLQYAPCMKSTITERTHCGSHYSLLVDQVSQRDIISKSTLCCSHVRFKQCVQRVTRRLCDGGVRDGPASRFSSQTLDKALSFLHEQCEGYIPNSGDCTSISTDSIPFSDPLAISTSSSEMNPWSTIQDVAPKEIHISGNRPSTYPRATPTSWLPSSSIEPDNMYPPSPLPNEQMLGSRSRPASYGRASSWPDRGGQQISGNTIQMNSENAQTTTSRTDWTATSSWNSMHQNNVPTLGSTQYNNMGQGQIHSSTDPKFATSTITTWYPAAGNQLSNEVDEPNQQGWKKSRAYCVLPTTLSLLTIVTLSIF